MDEGWRPGRWRVGGLVLASVLWSCVVPFKPGEGTSGTGGTATGGAGMGGAGTGGTGSGSTGTGGPCGGTGEACCAGGVCNAPALACEAGTCLGCAVDVFAGEAADGACLRRKDGAIVCWGSNANGTLDCSGGPYLPRVIPGLGSPTKASVGEHVCAFGGGAGLLCWGRNGHGECGKTPFSSGEVLCPAELVTVALPNPATEVATTYAGTTVALLTDGRAFGWGNNLYGQLALNGTSDGNDHPTPIELTQLGGNNHDIAANSYVTCAATTSGAVRCMGWNQNGGLGTSQFLPYGSVADLALSGVDALFAGTSFMCALKGAEAWCWGDNFYGQLGSQTVEPSPDAVQVPLGRPVKQLSTGGEHACAILDDDTVWCWGNNQYLQLGYCTQGVRPPTQVFLDASKTLPLEAKRVAAAGQSTCAVDVLDRSYCWGKNDKLQVGIENGKMDACLPQPVAVTCM